VAAEDGEVVVGRTVKSWGHAQNPDAVWVQHRDQNELGRSEKVAGLAQTNANENSITALILAMLRQLKEQNPVAFANVDVRSVELFDSAIATSSLAGTVPVTFHGATSPYCFTIKPPPVYYISIELPDKTSVNTDVATTLRKEDLPLTVDGLKEAVLKKFERDADFQGKSVRHLTVYPPGKEKGAEAYGTGAKVGGLSTILVAAPEEAPYHVVVV